MNGVHLAGDAGLTVSNVLKMSPIDLVIDPIRPKDFPIMAGVTKHDGMFVLPGKYMHNIFNFEKGQSTRENN